MIFYYPKNAITAKDISRFTYRTYDAIGINLNKYNNDSSNTFYLIDAASIELERILYDINYQFNPSLANVDFITIDRINRFYINNIKAISFNQQNGVVSCEVPIVGFSKYTGKSYDLKNVNKFTDFTRHSYPCDVVFCNEVSAAGTPLPTLVTLAPNVRSVFNTPITVRNSKVTIRIEDGDIKDILLLTPPTLSITGLNGEYKTVSEIIEITKEQTITTVNEYVAINSILLIGTSKSVSISVEPFIKNKTAKLDYNYIDRDEQYEFNALFSLDQAAQTLLVNRADDTFSYPSLLDPYEEIDINLGSTSIVDYHFDEQNKILNIISEGASGEKYLKLYPLIQPKNDSKIPQLNNTLTQNVKVSYYKDSILKKYVFTFQPAQKTHGVDELNMSILHSYTEARGYWQALEEYYAGDLVEYAGSEYISLKTQSGLYFDIDGWKLRAEYIVQGLVLDLITYGIENNKVEIDFSTLFSTDTETIIQIETSGRENCSFQILCNNTKLDPILSVRISELFSHPNPSLYVPGSTDLSPIINTESMLLSDKINGYDVVLGYIYSETDPISIYKISSTNKIYINGKSLLYVFDTFYMDWANTCVITSDTITHIIN